MNLGAGRETTKDKKLRQWQVYSKGAETGSHRWPGWTERSLEWFELWLIARVELSGF